MAVAPQLIGQELPVAVEVVGVGGHLCSLKAERDWSVQDVKRSISHVLKWHPSEQRLLIGQAILKDRDQLLALAPTILNDPCAPRVELSLTLVRCSSAVARFLQGKNKDIRHAEYAVRSDPECVLEAVGINWYSLQWASPDLQRDPRLLTAAKKRALDPYWLRRNEVGSYQDYSEYGEEYRTFKFKAEDPTRGQEECEWSRVTCEYEVIEGKPDSSMKILVRDKINLRDCGRLFVADADMVLAAVRHEPMQLEYAAETLRESANVVRVAVRQNGLALEYAGEALREDPEMVVAAVRQNGLALRFAAEPLLRNTRIVAVALGSNPAAVEHLHAQHFRTSFLLLHAFFLGGYNCAWKSTPSSPWYWACECTKPAFVVASTLMMTHLLKPHEAEAVLLKELSFDVIALAFNVFFFALYSKHDIAVCAGCAFPYCLGLSIPWVVIWYGRNGHLDDLDRSQVILMPLPLVLMIAWHHLHRPVWVCCASRM